MTNQTEIRKQAEAEFEQQNPRPVALELVVVDAPRVARLADELEGGGDA